MKISQNTRGIQCCIALDTFGKEYVLAGEMNAVQEWVMPPRRPRVVMSPPSINHRKSPVSTRSVQSPIPVYKSLVSNF